MSSSSGRPGLAAVVLGPALRWRVARVVAWLVLCGVLLLPATGLVAPLVLVNTGTSMPRGLYLHDPFARLGIGTVVVVRNPPSFKLPWLMKRVEGVAGELYCWHPELGTHTIDGRPMPPPWPEAIRMGIPVWTGCKVLAADELVGYGQSPDSFDGRYLGPFQVTQLWGVYRGVLTER